MNIKRSFNLLVGATLLLYVGMILVAALLYTSNRNRAQDGRDAHKAICLLVQNLETRVSDSQEFLRHHPNGIPGISRSDINRSIQGQQSTINALRKADCP